MMRTMDASTSVYGFELHVIMFRNACYFDKYCQNVKNVIRGGGGLIVKCSNITLIR